MNAHWWICSLKFVGCSWRSARKSHTAPAWFASHFFTVKMLKSPLNSFRCARQHGRFSMDSMLHSSVKILCAVEQVRSVNRSLSEGFTVRALGYMVSSLGRRVRVTKSHFVRVDGQPLVKKIRNYFRTAGNHHIHPGSAKVEKHQCLRLRGVGGAARNVDKSDISHRIAWPQP
jgi:hypothetical protein